MNNINTKNIKKILFYLSLAILAYVFVMIVNYPNWDLWIRLAAGSVFFQTGTILKHDIFSYTSTKDLWINHEWISSAIFYFMTHLFGDWGLFILKAVSIFLLLVLIVKIYRLQICEAGVSNDNILYMLFIIFSIIPGIEDFIRAQIFTFVFFMLWIYVLERVRRNENRLLWILPATMVLWANMNTDFIIGLVLLFIYALGEYLNEKNFIKYLIILVFSLLATLINPYGIAYWDFIKTEILQHHALLEWQPIDLLNGASHIAFGMSISVYSGFVIFALLSIITGIILLFKETKPDWVKILLLGILFYLSIKYQKFSIFFVLSASSLLYGQYVNIFQYLKKLILNKFNEKTGKFLHILKNSINYAVILAICIFILPVLPKNIFIAPTMYPIGSIEFIKQNNLSGNLITTYNWGSYAAWSLFPKCLVFIDGRDNEVYPENRFNEALAFSSHLDNNWSKFLKLYHTDIIILPKNVYTIKDIHSLTNWSIVYEDLLSVVLLPNNKVKKSFIIPNFNNKIYWHQDLSKPVSFI